MVATPHVSSAYPLTRAEDVTAAVQTLEARAVAAQIRVRLVAGAEIEVMHSETLQTDDLPGLRLGGGPFSLIELPFTSDSRFAEMLLGLHGDLLPAVLAHPERCRAFHEDSELLPRLVEQGLLVQITAASFTGAYGSTVQRAAWDMLKQGLVHVAASDAHDAERRAPLLREPLESAGLGALVETLCQDNPAAILRGEWPAPVPGTAVPRAPRTRRLRRGLRRR